MRPSKYSIWTEAPSWMVLDRGVPGGLAIKNITGPDPAKFTESTEDSGPGLRNLSENDDLSVPECSSGSGSNR